MQLQIELAQARAEIEALLADLALAVKALAVECGPGDRYSSGDRISDALAALSRHLGPKGGGK